MLSIRQEQLELALQELLSGDLEPLRQLLLWWQRDDSMCGLLGRLALRQACFSTEEIQEGRRVVNEMLKELGAIDEAEAAQRVKRLARTARGWARLLTEIIPGIAGRPPVADETLKDEVQRLQERGLRKRKAVEEVARQHSISARAVWRALGRSTQPNTVISDSAITERSGVQAVQPSQIAHPLGPRGRPDSALRSKPRTTRG